MRRLAKIRYADEVLEEECNICPYSSCAHPLQQIFTKYEDSWTSYRKLCIKDLPEGVRKRVLSSMANEDCIETSKLL